MAKIAILHEVLGRSKGGIEAWIFHASEELIREGHEVVIYHTMGKDVPNDAGPKSANIISLDIKKVKPSVFFIRSVLSYRSQLKDVLKGYDQIWSRSFGMAWAASKIEPRKSIYINAAPYSYYAYRPLGLQLKNIKNYKDIIRIISFQLSYKVSWYFEKEAIRNSKNVYLSKKRKEQTLSFFNLIDSPNLFKVVPAGVDNIRFKPRPEPLPFKNVLNIISVCRLDKLKNIQCVISAVKILINKGFSIKYTIIGDGIYKNELIRLVKYEGLDKYVFFNGRQTNVEKCYQENHLFILPSLYEGFGSVYIEAMACGLPSIALSNKSGLYSVAADEIIEHAVNGFLMKKNSADELAGFILEFFKNPELLNEFGLAARASILKNFSWEKSVKEILNF